MRAVALSNDRIIDFLNENFINTWVPNSELGRTPSLRDPIAKRREREGRTFDTSHALAQAIMKGWKKHSPVDTLIISPEFEVIGKQPINDIGWPMDELYLTFLKDSIAGKLPGFGEDTTVDSVPLFNSDRAFSDSNVVLSDQSTSQEVLSIFRTPEWGYQDYTVINIDATAFEKGGILSIHIWVGNTEPSGSFDLYDGDSELPTKGMPDGALASAWDIPPVNGSVIEHYFYKGQTFKLGATGNWFSEPGSINAFLVKISVEPISEEQDED